MISIHTNLSSLIAQRNLKSSTDLLNQAIERMTTGYKINGAKDNAANYSIATNMDTKIGAYNVAEDNCAMGLDMVTTMSSHLELITEHIQRIRDLCEQASNGTYGEQSLKAIQSEINSRQDEIERLMSSAEFNGINLFEDSTETSPVLSKATYNESGVTGMFIAEVEQLTEEEALTQGYTVIKTADDLQNIKNNLSDKYILMNDINLSGFSWTPIGSFMGELNGNGYIIKGLEIINTEQEGLGLFARIEDAKILNLGIEGANVVGNDDDTAILAGAASNVKIENVYVTGSVTGGCFTGGLIGFCGSSEITNCYTNVDVKSDLWCVGGLIGNSGSDIISNCFTKGTVTPYSQGGGIIGESWKTQILDSYTTCTMNGDGWAIASVIGWSEGYTLNNVYYQEQENFPGLGTDFVDENMTGTPIPKTSAELQEMIDNGTLVSAKAPTPVLPTPSTPPTSSNSSNLKTLQIGIYGESNSQIEIKLMTKLPALNLSITDDNSARASLVIIDDYLNKISDMQTDLGASMNRLESVLEEITIQRENLVSSRSTLRDADIAEVSSTYIQQQILQQASATLLSTANQTPSIALQLI